MKYVFVPREGDEKHFSEEKIYFEKLSEQELIECYQKQLRCGITGVHAQAVFLLALRKVMLQRLGESPIKLEEGTIIGLPGD